MKSTAELLEKCARQKVRLVVIGASAGGVEVLTKLLPSFKKPSPLSIALVLHLPKNGPNLIPELLRHDCSFDLRETASGEELKSETIYMAPPDYHLAVESNGTLTLSSDDVINYSRPSIDYLFEEAAHAYGKQVMGVLLTGANEDGAQGLKKISAMGGVSLVQDPLDAVCPTMPESALKLIKPDIILPVGEMVPFFESLCRRMNDGH